MSEKKCKHDNGWLSIDQISIFVFPSGQLNVNFSKLGKFLMRCNHTKCFFVRNGYLTKKGFKYGKIRPATKEEREKMGGI